MKRLTNGTAPFVMLMLIGMTTFPSQGEARVVLRPGAAQHYRAPSSHEFLLEGGLAEPMGDQKEYLYLVNDDLQANKLGLGQGTGYEIGLRFREYLSEYFAVSPSFHYIRMGGASGVMEYAGSQDLAYTVQASTYKYGLDFHAFMGGPGSSFRPFLTGGVALAHNVYRDELQYEGFYKTSVNAPAYSAGLGFKFNSIELVGEYTYNRFDSASLPPDEGPLSYNWDYFVIRAAISFGR